MNLHGEPQPSDAARRLRGAMQLVARTYPDAGALTMGRLAKILYLADWYAVRETGSTVTGLRWFFDERGPSAQELGEVVADEARFGVRTVENKYGSLVRVIEALDALDVVAVPYAVWDAVGRAVSLAASAPWPVFLATVLETPPLAGAEFGQYVDPAAYGASQLPGAA